MELARDIEPGPEDSSGDAEDDPHDDGPDHDANPVLHRIKPGHATGRVSTDEIRQRDGDEGAGQAADAQVRAGCREGASDLMSVRLDLTLAGGYPILPSAPRAPLILLGHLVGRDTLLAHRVGDLLLFRYHVFAYDRLAIQARSVPPPYDRIGTPR
jgi:hypothetical protein